MKLPVHFRVDKRNRNVISIVYLVLLLYDWMLFGVANEDQLQNIGIEWKLVSFDDTGMEIQRDKEYLNNLDLSVVMTYFIPHNAMNESRNHLSLQNNLDHLIVRIQSLFIMVRLSLHRIGFNVQASEVDLHEAWKGNLSSILLSTDHLQSLLQHMRSQIVEPYILPFPFRFIFISSAFPYTYGIEKSCGAMIIPLKNTGYYFDLSAIFSIHENCLMLHLAGTWN